jgi:hypothetical protein
MQALVEYSSGEGSDSSANVLLQSNTPAPQLPSEDATVEAGRRGQKRSFDHVEGQWAATVMVLGAQNSSR